jgi:hypothetical protein
VRHVLTVVIYVQPQLYVPPVKLDFFVMLEQTYVRLVLPIVIYAQPLLFAPLAHRDIN